MEQKTILTAAVLIGAVLVFVADVWAIKELILAPIPTPLIVAGCAKCVILATAVALAAINGIIKINQPKTTSK